jgi:RNA polymerase sigma-70 factor, ECF subfamily
VEETVDKPRLVARAREGDAAAWETLYRRAYPQLLAYAARRLDPDGARDAVSETMARAVAHIDRFTWEGAGFDGWLFGILRNVVHDAQRASRRRAPSEDLVDFESLEPGPLDHVLGTEEASALRAAFCRLNAADQEVLELRVVAGLSSEEVAAAIGKRPGAVRMAQARALDRLRELLKETP